jgi:CubicO group peptidase (beta-lactamase class C family)
MPTTNKFQSKNNLQTFKIIKINICVLLLSFLMCFATQFSLAQKRETALDSFFTTIDKNGDICGSVLIAENSKIIYQKSFGYADAQNKILNTSNTLFQIASVSKIFTAIAVVQLHEQKKLNLDDKFSKYFPDCPYQEVTIRQMLSNTSGIPNTGDVFVPLWRLNRDTIFTLNDIRAPLKTC